MKQASGSYRDIGVGKKPELRGSLIEEKSMLQIRGREQSGAECGSWLSKHSSLMHMERRLFRLGAGDMQEMTRPGHVIVGSRWEVTRPRINQWRIVTLS